MSAHAFFWLSHDRPAALAKSVKVLPLTEKGRDESLVWITASALIPPKAPVNVCKLLVFCRCLNEASWKRPFAISCATSGPADASTLVQAAAAIMIQVNCILRSEINCCSMKCGVVLILVGSRAQRGKQIRNGGGWSAGFVSYPCSLRTWSSLRDRF